MLTSVVGRGWSWGTGDIVELPAEQAEAWADDVRAVLVDDDEEVDVPEERIHRPAGRQATATPEGRQAVDEPAGEQAVVEPGGEQASDEADEEAEHVCDECGFEAKNAAGLAAHKRSHDSEE